MSRFIRDKVNHTDIPVAGLTDSIAIKNDVSAIEDVIDDMNNVLGAKNLLPNSATSQTNNGITYTVNADGSIVANGTADSINSSYIRPTENDYFIPTDGEYILSGNPIDGDENNWITSLNIYDATQNQVAVMLYGTEEQSVYLYANHLYRSTCIVAKGETVSNVIFKPMLRPASIADDTFVPYAKTNYQLTPIELVQTQTVSTSEDTTYTFTDARITTDSTIFPYVSIWGVTPSNVVTTEGQCVVTIPKQGEAVSLSVKISIT